MARGSPAARASDETFAFGSSAVARRSVIAFMTDWLSLAFSSAIPCPHDTDGPRNGRSHRFDAFPARYPLIRATYHVTNASTSPSTFEYGPGS